MEGGVPKFKKVGHVTLAGAWPVLGDLTTSSTYLFGYASLTIGLNVIILEFFCI